MESISAARKQKLALLRKRRTLEQTGQPIPSSSSSSYSLIKRHFRNYDPLTGQLRRFTSHTTLPDTVEKDVATLQSDTVAEDEKRRKQDLDLTNIAPKRINWDLKRDLEKRLKKLERKDKEAVLRLIRERVKGQQKNGLAQGKDGEESVTGLGAEIVASATVDLGRTGSGTELSGDESEEE